MAYGLKTSTQRDEYFTAGEYLIVVQECSIEKSTNKETPNQLNARFGGTVVNSRGKTFMVDGQPTTPTPLPPGIKATVVSTTKQPLYFGKDLGDMTKAVMDSIHLTFNGPDSPVRDALKAAMTEDLSARHITDATKRYKKHLRDPDEGDDDPWCDADQYIKSGKGKNFFVNVSAWPHKTDKGLLITKVLFKGIDQAPHYTLDEEGNLQNIYGV